MVRVRVHRDRPGPRGATDATDDHRNGGSAPMNHVGDNDALLRRAGIELSTGREDSPLRTESVRAVLRLLDSGRRVVGRDPRPPGSRPYGVALQLRRHHVRRDGSGGAGLRPPLAWPEVAAGGARGRFAPVRLPGDPESGHPQRPRALCRAAARRGGRASPGAGSELRRGGRGAAGSGLRRAGVRRSDRVSRAGQPRRRDHRPGARRRDHGAGGRSPRSGHYPRCSSSASCSSGCGEPDRRESRAQGTTRTSPAISAKVSPPGDSRSDPDVVERNPAALPVAIGANDPHAPAPRIC